MANNVNIQIVVLLTILDNILCRVDWNLEALIEIGKPFKLKCEFRGDLRNVSRQWTGGENNRLISFNGVTTDPVKYKEIPESSRTYTLQINEASEHDLNYPYSCRFGFEFFEKMLSVTRDNFLAYPDENSTQVSYLNHGSNFSLYIDFKRVYPIPECELYKGGRKIKLNVSRTKIYRILYDVSLNLESEEYQNDCGETAYLLCKIGTKTFSRFIENQTTCNEEWIWTRTVIAVGITVMLLVWVFVFAIHYLRRKIYHQKNTESHHPFEIVHLNEKTTDS